MSVRVSEREEGGGEQKKRRQTIYKKRRNNVVAIEKGRSGPGRNIISGKGRGTDGGTIFTCHVADVH